MLLGIVRDEIRMSQQNQAAISAVLEPGSGACRALIQKAVKSATFKQLLMPMGVPTMIEADSEELLATASAACPASSGEAYNTAGRIEISLTTASVPSSGMSCEITVEGSRLRLVGADFSGEADADVGTGACSVPPRLIGDAESFAAELFDTLLLFLLARSGRTPMHAAGFLLGKTAMLLAGPSGSGKSTLALAGAARGLPILSDDMVFVELEPRLRVWGLARPIHVFPEDAPRHDHPVRLRNGKRKAVVNVGISSTALFADEAVVVLLDRGHEVALNAIEPGEAVEALTRLEPGFDLLAEATAAAAQAIAARGAWRLTLSDNPADAIDCLLERFAQR